MVELLLEGQVILTGTTKIGAGAQPDPDPTPQPPDGVEMVGDVIDLDTDRGISGAIILVLKPGITLATFEWTDEELHTSAEADRRGYFELPDLLERGECYTLIVGAQNYWTFGQDDICIDDDIPEVWEVTVSLEKK
jgi:hypothetical protein